MRPASRLATLSLTCLLTTNLFAQSNTAAAAGLAAGAALGASSGGGSTTPSTAGGSSAPIEMNIMVYGAVKTIASEIANQVNTPICGKVKCPDSLTPILLEDTTTPGFLSIYFSWDAIVKALDSQLKQINADTQNNYAKIQALQTALQSAIDKANSDAAKAPPQKKKPEKKTPFVTEGELEDLKKYFSSMALAGSGAGTGAAAAAPTPPMALTYLGDIGTALSTFKSGMTYSSSSITPATQAMTAELGKALLLHKIELYTTQSLLNLRDPAGKVFDRVTDLQSRNATIQATSAKSTDLPEVTGAAKDDPTVLALKASSTVQIKPLATSITSEASVASQILTSFLTWQASTDNAGSIILADVLRGEALNEVMADGIPAIQINIDAAGGNMRTNNYFLLNLFYTPKPSFNAGLVVSFELRGRNNTLLAANTLKRIYDYSKWRPDCFAMTETEVNDTSLGVGKDTKPHTKSFTCETKDTTPTPTP